MPFVLISIFIVVVVIRSVYEGKSAIRPGQGSHMPDRIDPQHSLQKQSVPKQGSVMSQSGEVSSRTEEGSWLDSIPEYLRDILDDPDMQPSINMNKKNESKPAIKSTSMASDEGMSRTESDGCFGGSLPHENDHIPTVGSMGSQQYTDSATSAKSSWPTAESLAMESTPRLSATELRNAVVMSEILAKPVTLRQRGYRL